MKSHQKRIELVIRLGTVQAGGSPSPAASTAAGGETTSSTTTTTTTSSTSNTTGSSDGQIASGLQGSDAFRTLMNSMVNNMATQGLNAPPEERFQTQLETLSSMGFVDRQANIQGESPHFRRELQQLGPIFPLSGRVIYHLTIHPTTLKANN